MRGGGSLRWGLFKEDLPWEVGSKSFAKIVTPKRRLLCQSFPLVWGGAKALSAWRPALKATWRNWGWAGGSWHGWVLPGRGFLGREKGFLEGAAWSRACALHTGPCPLRRLSACQGLAPPAPLPWRRAAPSRLPPLKGPAAPFPNRPRAAPRSPPSRRRAL